MMEMGSSSLRSCNDKEETITRDEEFLGLVFSWSFEDICNENLYAEKVKKIPRSFQTLPSCRSPFVFPLLEETRADLCSSMEIISRAPFAEVVSLSRPSTITSLSYVVTVDEWKNRFNDRGKEPYRVLPGDIVAFMESRPDTVHGLHLAAKTWVLGCVTKISDNEDDDCSSSTWFKVKSSKEIEIMNYDSLFVVFLMNVTTNKRIWNAIHKCGNVNIIKEVMQSYPEDEGADLHCCSQKNSLIETLDSSLLSELNPSQNEAVSSSLCSAQCEQKSHVKLVWGPPGTGKTKTISILLYMLLKRNHRILTCAPTNVAVKELARRVLGLVKNSFSGDSSGGFFSVGNILLFGSKERMKVDPDIEDIYLDYRIKRLSECFAPLTGWRNCFVTLRNFLENCVSDYEIFVENELSKNKDENDDIKDTPLQIDSFLDFVRTRFKAAAKPVRRCLSVFSIHMPTSFIQEDNYKSMLLLFDLLDSFESSLLQENLVSEEIRMLFSTINAVEDSGANTLERMRRNCISFLKVLYQSLDGLNLPIVMSKESLSDLCFQMASLVFCTTSSSYKLYRMGMEPLNVLVIDEAAQLKECESMIPLQLPGMKHAILCGDEFQLPATVKSKISSNADFGRSLFQRLSSLGWPKHLLNVQYRMHPLISAFPNSQFYFNQLSDAPCVKSKSYKKHYLPGPMFGPYSFLNISEGREEKDGDERSRRNLVEAAVVRGIVQRLYKAWHCSDHKLSIGIISPYAAQVVAIEEMIGQRYEKLDNFSVKVKSVDGFQGGEEDVIILSTVRSNTIGLIGFISDAQRTNVSLTRARHCLWILGNERTLATSDSVWKAIICNAKERNCFFNAHEDKSIAQTIIDVKKELDQIDDLLNKDSVLFKFARWKVLFSDNFVKSFSKLPSTRVKKSVMNLLVKLSNGWRPRKIRVDASCESLMQIVKQYKVEGLYVICTNDIMKESLYSQVLKIWDVLPLEDIPKLVKRLENLYGAFTDDFLSRCREKGIEGDLEVPRSWSASFEITRYKSQSNAETPNSTIAEGGGGRYVENATVNESLLLMKFYSLSAGTVSHLLSDSDGRALDLPFEVTDQQLEIVLFNRSTFILGRSGTGKTVVLTMKLFQKEKLHYEASGHHEVKGDVAMGVSNCGKAGQSETVLRQLFVTVSPRLCYAVKEHVSHLMCFARGESSGNAIVPTSVDDDGFNVELFKDIPDSFNDIPTTSYPLVISFDKFLLMLDGSLGSSYFDRFHNEANLSHMGSTHSKSLALITLIKRKEVGYDKFSSSYWPHFNSQLTRKLDPSRVFTEIISCIKGGLQVGQTNDGKLSLEVYLDLSEVRVSTLSRRKREMIYEIFLDYEKMKMERGEYDLADFVNDLHHRLQREKYEGDIMEFVYVDEVQDLTMRQIALFKYICKNVEEGFVFSGDTAQTIARGIDFRFQDVRCLFFKEFFEGENSDGRQGKGQMSPIWHLSQNFRTHDGVLKLSESIIRLIYHFFPHSVDILSPETSRIYGEAPILLESGNDENAIVKIFGNNANAGGDMIGFGAEQVILVRDDSARQEISNFVGKNALVLTIIECKGLEFQDVLLYNFFGSSPLRNQWRLIYEFMEEQNLLDPTLPQSFPSFNMGKHNVLCSELKQLYVAITRTRQRLWVCENREDLSKPMFDYWKKLCLVQVRQLDDSLVRAMQVASTKEEWKQRGIKLLRELNYEVATMCFERAGDSYRAKLAKAAGLQAAAEQILDSQNERACEMLKQAAKVFESINKVDEAAKCYFWLKDYEKAGRIYLDKCGDNRLVNAGECFTLAGCFELAAEVYAKANRYSECLFACTQGNLFDTGLQYIQYWKQQATASEHSSKISEDIFKIEQEFLEKYALSFYEQGDKRTMMKFVRTFRYEDSMRNFLMGLGCLDELLSLEEELGNYSKAADIARERGEFLLEGDLLHKAGLFEEASAIFRSYLFTRCLWESGGKGWPMKNFSGQGELIVKLKLSSCNVSQLYYKRVCTDILILLNDRLSLPELKQQLLLSQSVGYLGGEIICIRRILDSLMQIDVSKYEYQSKMIENLTMHSLDTISQNQASVETLIYFWSIWKEKVSRIHAYIGTVEAQEITEDSIYEDFCVNFFGVRKQLSCVSAIYILLYSDAEWVREINRKFFRKYGKLNSIDAQQFVTAAQSYWNSELLSVGMKLLQNLDVLLKFITRTNFPISYKCRVLFHVYEVSRFLFSLKLSKQGHSDSRSLQVHIERCIEEYFHCVFPIDWRKSVTKDMILLRKMEVSDDILSQVIVKTIGSKCMATYGQIGLVAMVMFGSARRLNQFGDIDLSRTEMDFSWKLLLEHLCGTRSEQSIMAEQPLAAKLFVALKDVYNVNWSNVKDYISPPCFLYLVDRLLISLSVFKGRVLSARSSVLDWVISPNANLTGTALVNPSLFVETCNFLANALHQLLMNPLEMVHWVRKAGLSEKFDYPLLLLRLVVLMCLVHLNSNSNDYWQLILNVLNHFYIKKELPFAFSDALRRRKGRSFVNVVAEALKTIDDPLVILNSEGGRPNLSCADAIYLDTRGQNQEEILRVLFPETVESKISSSCVPVLPASIGNQEQHPQIKDGNVWEALDALKLLESDDDTKMQSFLSNAPKIKMLVDTTMNLVADGKATILNENASADEEENIAEEADSMLYELRILSAAMNARKEQLKERIPLMRHSSRLLLSENNLLERFLTRFIPRNIESPSSVTPQEVNVKLENDDDNEIVVAEEQTEEKPPAAVTSTNNGGQGGGKNKKKKSKGSKKSKGGRGK